MELGTKAILVFFLGGVAAHIFARLAYPWNDKQQPWFWLATMTLFADASSEHVIARVQANSQMFGQMTVISEKPHPEAAQQRIVKMRLQLR